MRSDVNKTVKRALTYGFTGVAAFGVGYVMQPPSLVVPLESTTKTVVEVMYPVPVPVLGPVRTVVIEKQPTPRPTDCLVMRWR